MLDDSQIKYVLKKTKNKTRKNKIENFHGIFSFFGKTSRKNIVASYYEDKYF